jgi:NTP pyrophosphatase (non-canonical NTP hydrolase)
MSDIADLISRIRKFNKERDWQQFHSTKDVAISLALEAAELLEHYQWKNGERILEHEKAHREDIADELADVIVYALQLADQLDFDVTEIVKRKIEKNATKYPIEKSIGSSKKYTEL